MRKYTYRITPSRPISPRTDPIGLFRFDQICSERILKANPWMASFHHRIEAVDNPEDIAMKIVLIGHFHWITNEFAGITTEYIVDGKPAFPNCYGVAIGEYHISDIALNHEFKGNEMGMLDAIDEELEVYSHFLKGEVYKYDIIEEDASGSERVVDSCECIYGFKSAENMAKESLQFFLNQAPEPNGEEHHRSPKLLMS